MCAVSSCLCKQGLGSVVHNSPRGAHPAMYHGLVTKFLPDYIRDVLVLHKPMKCMQHIRKQLGDASQRWGKLLTPPHPRPIWPSSRRFGGSPALLHPKQPPSRAVFCRMRTLLLLRRQRGGMLAGAAAGPTIDFAIGRPIGQMIGQMTGRTKVYLIAKSCHSSPTSRAASPGPRPRIYRHGMGERAGC
jgi:hypothetical protein